MKDGIETILVPITHPHDLERLALEAGRGGYAVVEWLLSYLGRWPDLERVCGLSCSTEPGRVVVNLELRQPGRQIEEWLHHLKPPVGGDRQIAVLTKLDNGDVTLAYEDQLWTLSARSLDPTPFWDKMKPWWIQQNVVRELEEGDRIIP